MKVSSSPTARRVPRLLVAGLLGVSLAGCFPMYARPRDSRENLDQLRDFSFVVPGRTTRAQVMLRLGEPDGLRSENGRDVFYRSTHDTVGFFAVRIAGVLAQKNNYFLLEYDQRGVVRRLAMREQLDWIFETHS